MLLVMLLAGLLISYGVRRNYMRVRKHKKRSVQSQASADHAPPPGIE